MEFKDIKNLSHNKCVEKMLEVIGENETKIKDNDYKILLECLSQVRTKVTGYVFISYQFTNYCEVYEEDWIQHKQKIFKMIDMEHDIKEEFEIVKEIYDKMTGKQCAKYREEHNDLSVIQEFFKKYNTKFGKAWEKQVIFSNYKDYSDLIKQTNVKYRSIPDHIIILYDPSKEDDDDVFNHNQRFKTTQIYKIDNDPS